MTLSPRETLLAILADVEEEIGVDDVPATPRLAELWQGELERDLAAPVIKQIRFDQFVREIVALGSDVAFRMAEAAIEYTVGRDEADEEEA
jgi:hypothetical protein